MKRLTTSMVALLASAAAACAQEPELLAQQAQPGTVAPSWLGYDPGGGATVFAAPELRSDPLTGETLVAPGTGMTQGEPPSTEAERRELSDLFARRDALSPEDEARLDEQIEKLLNGPALVVPAQRVPRTPPPVLALPGSDAAMMPVPETPVPDAPSAVPQTPPPNWPFPAPVLPVAIPTCQDGRVLPSYCGMPDLNELEECKCD